MLDMSSAAYLAALNNQRNGIVVADGRMTDDQRRQLAQLVLQPVEVDND